MATNPELAVPGERAFFRPLRELDHAAPVQRDDDLLRVVVEILADDEHGLAIAVPVRIREGDIRGQRNVALQLLPQDTELVARVPDVVAGRTDGVHAVR